MKQKFIFILVIICSFFNDSHAMIARRMYSTNQNAKNALQNGCKIKRKSMVSHHFTVSQQKTHQAIIPITYLPQDSEGFFMPTPIRSVADICMLASAMAKRKSPLLLLSHGSAGAILAKTAQEYLEPRNLCIEKTIRENPDTNVKFCHLATAINRLLECRQIKPALIDVIQVEEESAEGFACFYDEIMIQVPESTAIQPISDLASTGLAVAYVGNIRL